MELHPDISRQKMESFREKMNFKWGGIVIHWTSDLRSCSLWNIENRKLFLWKYQLFVYDPLLPLFEMKRNTTTIWIEFSLLNLNFPFFDFNLNLDFPLSDIGINVQRSSLFIPNVRQKKKKWRRTRRRRKQRWLLTLSCIGKQVYSIKDNHFC